MPYLKYAFKINQQRLNALLVCLALAALVACNTISEVSTSKGVGVGTNPELPEPKQSLIPTVHIAPAVGWPVNVTPIAAADLAVKSFARDLEHPRWLYLLPNGDVLVAETNAPPKPDDNKGIKAKSKA